MSKQNKKTTYLISYGCDRLKLIEAESVKDCIMQFMESYGEITPLFEKALVGCEDDISIIEMCNHFGSFRIYSLYAIDEIIMSAEN